MFEFENTVMEDADQAEANDFHCETFGAMPDPQILDDANWERITDIHATKEEQSGRADARQSPEKMKERIYRKIDDRRRERIGITAARYALLSVGCAVVCYLTREITGLSIVLGIVALIFALLSAYGIGRYRELR